MESPLAYRVVELVRAHIGTAYVTASDADVARALGVSRNAITEYKRGRSKMAPATAARALELLQGSAHEATPLLRELMDEQAHSEPEGAIWRALMQVAEAVRGKAAALVLAIVAAGTLYAPESNQALAGVLDGPGYTLYVPRINALDNQPELLLLSSTGLRPRLQSMSKPALSSAFV